MVQAFAATRISDSTPGSGGLAVALLMGGEGDMGYQGMCHTPDHMQLRRSQLPDRELARMNDESIILHNPRPTHHTTTDLSGAGGNTQCRGERLAV